MGGCCSAWAYLRTVTREMPSSRAMALRDSPFSLACWIAFHRAFWVGVSVRSHVIDALLATSFWATVDHSLVDPHRFQGTQTPLLGLADVVVAYAADDAFEFRAGRPGADPSPQCAHARRRFLRGHRMALILDDEVAVGSFQHLQPQSGVTGTFRIGKQLQDPPVVLHRVIAGDLAGVLEAQDLGEAKFRRHRAIDGFRMIRLHDEAGVETGQESPAALPWPGRWSWRQPVEYREVV